MYFLPCSPVLLRLSLPEYTEYAQIEMSDKGHRQFWLNGQKFGQYYQSSTETTWKCTRRGDLNGVKKQCRARLKTKTIGGHEILKSSQCVHDHD